MKNWKYIFLCFLLYLPHSAHAADEQGAVGAESANPFSDYVPFQDEYDVDEDERFMYFGRYFGVAIGTGFHEFSGNIGKLYNTAIPVLDFSLIYFFDFRLAGQIGFNNASHAFSTDGLSGGGLTEVNLFRVNSDLKYYFNTKDFGATITTSSPYFIAGISQVFRTQTNHSSNTVTKDPAFAVSAGAGIEFALKPRSTSIGFEGRVHDIFFRDRDMPTYVSVGIPDMRGLMYSFIAHIIFFF